MKLNSEVAEAAALKLDVHHKPNKLSSIQELLSVAGANNCIAYSRHASYFNLYYLLGHTSEDARFQYDIDRNSCGAHKIPLSSSKK